MFKRFKSASEWFFVRTVKKMDFLESIHMTLMIFLAPNGKIFNMKCRNGQKG